MDEGATCRPRAVLGRCGGGGSGGSCDPLSGQGLRLTLAPTLGLKTGFRFGPCSFLPFVLLALAAEPKPPLRAVVDGALRALRPLILPPSAAAGADARTSIPLVAESAPIQLRRCGALHRLPRPGDGETCDGLLDVEAPSAGTLHPAALGHSLGGSATTRNISRESQLSPTTPRHPTVPPERVVLPTERSRHSKGCWWPRQARTRPWPLAMDTAPQSATTVQAAKETLESTY